MWTSCAKVSWNRTTFLGIEPHPLSAFDMADSLWTLALGLLSCWPTTPLSLCSYNNGTLPSAWSKHWKARWQLLHFRHQFQTTVAKASCVWAPRHIDPATNGCYKSMGTAIVPRMDYSVGFDMATNTFPVSIAIACVGGKPYQPGVRQMGWNFKTNWISSKTIALWRTAIVSNRITSAIQLHPGRREMLLKVTQYTVH